MVLKTDLNHKNLFIFLIIITYFLLSCGLAQYEVLDPPRMYSPGDNQVGFQTPDNEIIDGYIIYYKIYRYDDSTIDTDESYFNPDNFEDESSDYESGTAVPEELDFFMLGFLGTTTNETFPHISQTGSGHYIAFDFTDSLNQNTDPILLIDGTNYNQDIGVPARGVKYKDNTFKSFINNYEFSNDSNEIDEDLDSMDDSLGSAETLDDVGTIEIAFVAISYGISASSFEQMMSIPVHLGTVQINNFVDANGNTSN